jgi:hypothetical protein
VNNEFSDPFDLLDLREFKEILELNEIPEQFDLKVLFD